MRDFIASYLPFALLFALAILTAGSEITSDGGFTFQTWVWFVLGLACLAGVFLACVSLARHKRVRRHLDATFAENNH